MVKAHLQVENKPGFCQKPGLYTRDWGFTIDGEN